MSGTEASTLKGGIAPDLQDRAQQGDGACFAGMRVKEGAERRREERFPTKCATPPLVKPFSITRKYLNFRFRIPGSNLSLGQVGELNSPAAHPELSGDQPPSSQHLDDSP